MYPMCYIARDIADTAETWPFAERLGVVVVVVEGGGGELLLQTENETCAAGLKIGNAPNDLRLTLST